MDQMVKQNNYKRTLKNAARYAMQEDLPRDYKRYPWRQLAIGQEVLLYPEDQGFKNFASFKAMVWNQSRRLKRQFRCELLEGDVVKLWRES